MVYTPCVYTVSGPIAQRYTRKGNNRVIRIAQVNTGKHRYAGHISVAILPAIRYYYHYLQPKGHCFPIAAILQARGADGGGGGVSVLPYWTQ